MAIAIFLALNGLAVAFLLYVLVNFWREGHRPANVFGPSEPEATGKDWSDVAVLTHPISAAAHGGLAVIPFPVNPGKISAAEAGAVPAGKIRELAANRISTR